MKEIIKNCSILQLHMCSPALSSFPFPTAGGSAWRPGHSVLLRLEPLNGERLLVIDDDSRRRFLLSTFLSGEGLNVETVCDGPQALHLLGDNLSADARFDLLLFDLQMRGMDGFEFQRRLSERHGYGRRVSPRLQPRLPYLLAFTSHALGSRGRDFLFGEQVVGVMQRPASLFAVGQVVRDVLAWAKGRPACACSA